MRRSIAFVAIIFLLFLSTLLGQSIPKLPNNSSMVYGPQRFDAMPGMPWTIIEQFSLSAKTQDRYSLYVVNETAESVAVVTGLEIKINGVAVIARNDFSKKHPAIVKTVNLDSVNEIEIVFSGQGNSTITVAIAGTGNNESGNGNGDTSSAIISYEDLVDKLIAASIGRLDPFTVVSTICEKKDGAVAALDKYLSEGAKLKIADTLINSNKDSLLSPRPGLLLAVRIAEIIGTPSAGKTLLRTTQEYEDAQIRGEALNALSISYYRSVCANNYEPDVNIVGVLLTGLDDSTMVKGLRKTVDEITREGIRNWMGVDPGKQSKNNSMMTDPDTGEKIKAAQYRNTWWSNNGSKLKWNTESMKFKIR